MKVEQISKERLGAKVLFPRTQFAGITCDDKNLLPKPQDFDLELKHDVPTIGTVKLIVQHESPHFVFQLYSSMITWANSSACICRPPISPAVQTFLFSS